ncbi:hypothetical protein EJ068_25885 [Mesorhizobium sp. M2A.F.Ca.ET.043.02.1.1]|nr:hypothetical protein EJ068_25885 [Mesorhizobium sp. M2A.F.Ca.ET.043.02.1.1]
MAGQRPPLPCRASPPQGGDQQLCGWLFSCNVDSWRRRRRHPISPQVGEMSGRTEGGAKERRLRSKHTLAAEAPCSARS